MKKRQLKTLQMELAAFKLLREQYSHLREDSKVYLELLGKISKLEIEIEAKKSKKK